MHHYLHIHLLQQSLRTEVNLLPFVGSNAVNEANVELQTLEKLLNHRPKAETQGNVDTGLLSKILSAQELSESDS